MSEAEQMKLVIERSKKQLHSSQPSGSGAHEGTGVTPGVPDVPTYHSDDEQISWKSSDEDDDDEASIRKDDDDIAADDDDIDQDDDNDDDDEQTESDNDGDDFVHPKLTTHEDEERSDEEDKEEDNFDPRVHTPSHVETTDDEETFGGNVEEEINEEVPVQEVCRDENVNLMGSEVEMIDTQFNQDTEDAHVTLTTEPPVVKQQSSFVSSGFISNMLNPNPDTGTDFVLNVESNSLVDVPVTSNVKIPPTSATILPPLPLPLILPQQQTPVPTTTNAPIPSLQDLLNFGSLFGFDNRLKTLENNFSEFKQTNQFASALSSIPNIIDNYLGSKLKDAMDVATRNPSLDQTEGPREEELAKNPSQPVLQKKRPPRQLESLLKQRSLSVGLSAQAEEPMYTAKDLGEPTHQEFEIEVTEDQPVAETSHFPDWFQKPDKLPSPDQDPRESFDELMDTPLDFSAFMMNRLNVDTLTPELLAGPTIELVKGTWNLLGKSTSDVESLLEAYSAWNIYQNKDKKNKLMRVDELHKFSDGTLNDVRTALDDRLKGIRMEYLPHTIWRKSDRE
ncbi:hypothetical protein Tco_0696685 [Tanacetum coccineum]